MLLCGVLACSLYFLMRGFIADAFFYEHIYVMVYKRTALGLFGDVCYSTMYNAYSTIEQTVWRFFCLINLPKYFCKHI